MRSFIYLYISSGVSKEKLALHCVSAILLTLVSLPHVAAQTPSLQLPKLDESSQRQSDALMSDTKMKQAETIELNLTPEQQKTKQLPKQTVEETKKIQQLTLEQQKQLVQQLQERQQVEKLQKQLDPSLTQQKPEETRQFPKFIPENPKEVVLPQPLQFEKVQQQTELVKQGQEQLKPPSLMQIKAPIELQKTQQLQVLSTVIVQEKYQKLIDAGIFSTGSSSLASLDGALTRAQFAEIFAKLQSVQTSPGNTQFGEVDPVMTGGTVATKLELIAEVFTGSKSGDDKKSTATLADLLTALSKSGALSQTELDQLLAKMGAGADLAAKTAGLPAKNDDAILAANIATATIVNSTQGGAATTAGIAGVSAGSLASLALALTTTAAVAASSNANEIALANAANPGANYTVVLPRNNWPTNLSATYSGRLNGTLSDSSLVGGNLTMNVNFATIRSAAPIPGSVLFDNGKGSASLNLVQSGGFVGGGMNGTYNGQAMTGFITNGQFYGPAAEAIKGGWNMSTPTVNGNGTFAATR